MTLGLLWARQDIVSRGRAARAVVNMSALTRNGPRSVIGLVAAWLARSGVLLVVPAGNHGGQVTRYAPAGQPSVLTVGGVALMDTFMRPSNSGPEVDVFAPCAAVETADWRSEAATWWATGTSFAAPHVAGLALYLMQAEKYRPSGGFKSPQEVKDRIVELSTKDKITDLPAGTPNRFAYNGGYDVLK